MKKLEKVFNKDYFFGRRNSNYDNYYRWDNDWFWKSVINVIKKYKISGNALDVGCALGFLLKREKSYFKNIYGIDISDYAVGEARKKVPFAEVKKIDLDEEELPYSDGYFDFITALDVLEHTKSVEESLEKILKKLKNNGILMISVPLSDTITGKLLHLIDKDKTHISVPSRRDIFDLCSKFNLEILEDRYFLNAGYFKIWGIPLDIELVLRKKI